MIIFIISHHHFSSVLLYQTLHQNYLASPFLLAFRSRLRATRTLVETYFLSIMFQSTVIKEMIQIIFSKTDFHKYVFTMIVNVSNLTKPCVFKNRMCSAWYMIMTGKITL